MPFVQSHALAGKPVNIYFEDKGSGPAFVLVHSWPLSGAMWEYQEVRLLEAGCRVITYDRRGFGKSGQPGEGYDYDTMASDLSAVIEHTGAEDAVLVGFSMGGGEVAKYFTNFGGKGISKVILVSTVLPFLLQTEGNQDGVSKEVFDGMLEGIKDDRPTFLEGFNKAFYGEGTTERPVTDAFLRNANVKGMEASLLATLECAKAFAMTDFRKDIPAITVPTLIIHGTADNNVPIEKSSDKTAKLMPSATYKKYDGAPHGLWFTHMEELTEDFIKFCKRGIAEQL